MFNVVRLINDLDLKEDVFKAQKGENDVERIGYDMIFSILAKGTTKEAQKKIYEVLAKPYEKTAEEIGEMPYMEIVETFADCFDIKTLKNFIKRVNK